VEDRFNFGSSLAFDTNVSDSNVTGKYTTSYRYTRMSLEYLRDLYLQTYRLLESNAAACYFRMHWPSPRSTEERLNSERKKLTYRYF